MTQTQANENPAAVVTVSSERSTGIKGLLARCLLKMPSGSFRGLASEYNHILTALLFGLVAAAGLAIEFWWHVVLGN